MWKDCLPSNLCKKIVLWFINLNAWIGKMEHNIFILAIFILVFDWYFSSQDSFCHINEKLPIPLQDCSPISLIGSYGVACNGRHSRMVPHQMKDTRFGDSNGIIKNEVSYINSHNNVKHNTNILLTHEKADVNFGIPKSIRHNFKKTFENQKQSSIQNGSWIHLISLNQIPFPERTNCFPRLHNLYQKGKLLSVRHLHVCKSGWCHMTLNLDAVIDYLILWTLLLKWNQVIVYDPPTFCSHHFSLTSWNSWMQERTSLRKPWWFVERQNKNLLPDFVSLIQIHFPIPLSLVNSDSLLFCRKQLYCPLIVVML